MSKCSINAPAAAIIIIGGAMIANIGGNAPVAPNALNVFIRKYSKKHVIIPKLNFKPKLKFLRWRVCEKAVLPLQPLLMARIIMSKTEPGVHALAHRLQTFF